MREEGPFVFQKREGNFRKKKEREREKKPK